MAETFTIGDSAMEEGKAYIWDALRGMVYRHREGDARNATPVFNFGVDGQDKASVMAQMLNDAFEAGMTHEAYNRDCEEDDSSDMHAEIAEDFREAYRVVFGK